MLESKRPIKTIKRACLFAQQTALFYANNLQVCISKETNWIPIKQKHDLFSSLSKSTVNNILSKIRITYLRYQNKAGDFDIHFRMNGKLQWLGIIKLFIGCLVCGF